MERRAAAVQCEEHTDCVGHAAPASNFSTCKIPPGVWNGKMAVCDRNRQIDWSCARAVRDRPLPQPISSDSNCWNRQCQ